ncbi:MAG: hemolysin D [Deltaproteobacteria bacterium]|nr:MAG: hemolysin D [Deltaproteobacteria bacterium]PIE72666.1 MAG: hemolysin D [Deltaproteobacteria bacterium]
MGKQRLSHKRKQTRGEEIANSISHGIGFLAALIASPVLISSALRHGDAAGILGASVFLFTMALMYLTSSLYHAVTKSKAKKILQIVDHCSIFLFIAGTYTPFTLRVLGGTWGWTLFGTVWVIAFLGVTFQCLGGVRFKKLSILLYLAMGWIIIVAIKPLYLNIPGWGLFWLVGGGVAYTAGVGFYIQDRIRYTHCIWHLFVVAGTACHFIAIWKYTL